MTPEETNTAIQKSIAEALKPITTQLAALGETIKPIAELQTQVKSLVEKDSAATIASKEAENKGGKKTDTAAGAITAESVAKMVSDGVAAALKERDTASAATAQSEAQLTAFLDKNAPKLKGNPLAKILFASAKSDEDRKAVLNQYVESVKASGAKVPDLGATAAGEGGATTTADSAEAKKAAALEAAKGLKPVTL